jgi:hypothetical protein
MVCWKVLKTVVWWGEQKDKLSDSWMVELYGFLRMASMSDKCWAVVMAGMIYV